MIGMETRLQRDRGFILVVKPTAASNEVSPLKIGHLSCSCDNYGGIKCIFSDFLKLIICLWFGFDIVVFVTMGRWMSGVR